MLVRRFVYGIDDDFGNAGWILPGVPGYNAGDGLTVAHDTLEHRPNDNGTVEDELMALGALLWLRVETGYQAQYFPNGLHAGTHMIVTGDISRMLLNLVQDVAQDDCLLQALPRASRPLSDDDAEQSMRKAVAESIASTIAETGYQSIDPELVQAWNAKLQEPETYDRCLGWLRAGYRNAKRRYPRPEDIAFRVFQVVRSEADRIARFAEEGDELQVVINLKKAQASVRHIEGYSPEARYR